MQKILRQAISNVTVLCILIFGLVESTQLISQFQQQMEASVIAGASDLDRSMIKSAIYGRKDAVDAALGL